MDEGTESLEKETGEKRTSKIEVKDGRGEIADAIQEGEFIERLKNDKIEEKLIQFENFLGPYTKQKVAEGLIVNLVRGPFGSGEVINGVLSVNLPTSSEILAATNDPRAEQFLKVLTDAGTTYKEIALISASSTTLHELEYTVPQNQHNRLRSKTYGKFSNPTTAYRCLQIQGGSRSHQTNKNFCRTGW